MSTNTPNYPYNNDTTEPQPLDNRLVSTNNSAMTNCPTFTPQQQPQMPLAVYDSVSNPNRYHPVYSYGNSFSQPLVSSVHDPDNRFGLYQNPGFTSLEKPTNNSDFNNFGRPPDNVLKPGYNYERLPNSSSNSSFLKSAQLPVSNANLPSSSTTPSKESNSLPTTTHSNPQKPETQTSEENSHPKTKKNPKRKKTSKACVYCRRSHMTCNENRPCARCVARNIGHLCHDNESPGDSASHTGYSEASPYQFDSRLPKTSIVPSIASPLRLASQLPFSTAPRTFASEFMDNEYRVISQFLKNLDATPNSTVPFTETETFFLTAADQHDGTFEERLREIITAKYHAGLLKPYNYVNGYSRLQTFLDTHMSATSRQRVLNSISTFRPNFRKIAKSLTDIDLVLVEEGFERLLLDYDRVFSSMGIPACLWRRTGEIFKANKEFASLVGMSHELLKDGQVCIYELMTEDSAVSYWDKYGNIAFDPKQKAMLSSCCLKDRHANSEFATIPCCFSFTIRRDKYNIPSAIVGNFLPSSANAPH